MQDQKLLLKKPVSEIHPGNKPESKPKENKIRVDDDKDFFAPVARSFDGLETLQPKIMVIVHPKMTYSSGKFL